MLHYIEVTTTMGSKFVLSVFSESVERAIDICLELSSVVSAEVKNFEI